MTDPSTIPTSRAWVEIRLDRLRENAAEARRAAGAGSALVPMLKADGYGLGALPIAAALRTALERSALWGFGVATLPEAEQLREAGFTERVLVFPPLLPEEFPRAARVGVTLCLSDLDAIRELARVASDVGRRLPFHLEIDTGMGRTGFPWSEASRWGSEVVAALGEEVQWEGTFTHFHSADEADPAPTREQWRRFRIAVEALPPLLPAPLLHVANSAALMRFNGFGCDLARPGIHLFGGRAGPASHPRPVASLRARLVRVREVAPGTSVGYGALYSARGPERWGTVAIGYGDGVARKLAEAAGRVLVRGRSVPIIGRVSMDMLTIDLTRVPHAQIHDVATLIGSDGEEEITVEEVARRCGTISYEIFTRLGRRLPRVYLDPETPEQAHEDPARPPLGPTESCAERNAENSDQ